MYRVNIVARLIQLNERMLFYPKLRRFYKINVTKNAPVILDVGANKGQTIDFFLKLFGDAVIFGFEPNHILYRFLRQKYEGNPNVRLFNYGVSNRNGRLMFQETVTSETSTFEELNMDSDYLKMKSAMLGIKPGQMVRNTYEVDVITLSDFIRENNLSNIDIIKIDTEGHEFKCLQGLFNGPDFGADFIQIELHNDDMYANAVSGEAISNLLADNNYGLLKKIAHGFGDFDELIFAPLSSRKHEPERKLSFV